MRGKARLLCFILTLLAVIAVCLVVFLPAPKSAARAEKRAKAFVHAINYDFKTPEKIYPYLTEAYRASLTEEEFVKAFHKERSYPYLTPLFLNYESIEMNADTTNGSARFSQAARLPGMFVDIRVTYENGDYFMTYFEEFLDGSYLEKFEKLTPEEDK